MEYVLKTKFEIDDLVFGFVDGEVHEVKIDRIEINFERFDKTNPKYTRCNTIYLATTTDAKYNLQHRFKENQLFNEEELKVYVNKYFENRKNS